VLFFTFGAASNIKTPFGIVLFWLLLAFISARSRPLCSHSNSAEALTRVATDADRETENDQAQGGIAKRQSDDAGGATYDPALCERVMDLGRKGRSPVVYRYTTFQSPYRARPGRVERKSVSAGER
jgi:hypothetical protein